MPIFMEQKTQLCCKNKLKGGVTFDSTVTVQKRLYVSTEDCQIKLPALFFSEMSKKTSLVPFA